MLSFKHYYSNLNEQVTLALASIIKDNFKVSILEKNNFDSSFEWIEVFRRSKVSIASYDASTCKDTKLKLFYNLYNLDLSINLNSNQKYYSKMFTVAVYKNNFTRELLFKFYLGLTKRDLRKLSVKNNFSIIKTKDYKRYKKITLFSNTSLLAGSKNKKINLSFSNLFFSLENKVFQVKNLSIRQDILNLCIGDRMEESIEIGLELQKIEISFQDFNKLNVGSEIEMDRSEIKEIVIKVGESSYALADVLFNESGLSLKVRDLL